MSRTINAINANKVENKKSTLNKDGNLVKLGCILKNDFHSGPYPKKKSAKNCLFNPGTETGSEKFRY